MELLQGGHDIQQKLKIIDSYKHLLSSDDLKFLIGIAHFVCKNICGEEFIEILKQNDIYWMPQKNSLAALVMIALIFNVPVSEIKYINSGAVKSAYKLHINGRPYVIRVYDMVPIEQYYTEFISKGITESDIFAICHEHDPVKALTLIAQNKALEVLPIDISEYTANLASILDHILGNESLDPSSKERISAKLTQLLRLNKFSGNTSVEKRDAGLVRRDDGLYIVQFDFSHVVGSAIKKKLSYPDFKKWILTLFDASSSVHIEESSVDESIP